MIDGTHVDVLDEERDSLTAFRALVLQDMGRPDQAARIATCAGRAPDAQYNAVVRRYAASSSTASH